MRTKKIMVIDTETTVKGEVFDMGLSTFDGGNNNFRLNGKSY